MVFLNNSNGTTSFRNEKPRVYFCGHPEETSVYNEKIAADVRRTADCDFWHAENGEARDREFFAALERMNLIIVFVTKKFLSDETGPWVEDVRFAVKQGIPLLPLLLEEGLIDAYGRIFGTLQFLDRNDKDRTALGYEEKLAKFLNAVLLNDEKIEKIQARFDGRIFLSYRKKDRRYARELMQLIHRDGAFPDVAVWYDEFLVPGEEFNEKIESALKESDLFLLSVTPNLLEEVPDSNGVLQKNYVAREEYPMATREHKPVLPVEMIPTDAEALAGVYDGIPRCIDARKDNALAEEICKHLNRPFARPREWTAEQRFYLGLAYLHGIGVETDRPKGVALITEAAQADFPEAVDTMVFLCARGFGLPRDFQKMLCWQEKLIRIRRARYEASPSEDTALALLTEVEAMVEPLQRSGDSARLPNRVKDFFNMASEAFSRYPSAQTARFLEGSLQALGTLYGDCDKTAESLAAYRKCEELIRSVLKAEGIELLSDGTLRGEPKDPTVHILLRDYGVCRCAIGDILFSAGEAEQADEIYRSLKTFLETSVMQDSYAEYDAHLSTVYSRLARSEDEKGNTEEAYRAYRKALTLDEKRVAQAMQTKDFEAFADFARGLVAAGMSTQKFYKAVTSKKVTAEEESAPQFLRTFGLPEFSRLCICTAYMIFTRLAKLVPEFPAYKEMADELQSYAEYMAEEHNRTVGNKALRIHLDSGKIHIFSILKYPEIVRAKEIVSTLKNLLNLREEAAREVEAFRLVRTLAEQGNSKSMLDLADRYLKGKGTEPDAIKAIDAAEKAAEAGYVPAYGWLADFYYETNPTKADEYARLSEIGTRKEAFEAALKSYDPQDMLLAAEEFRKGEIVPADVDRALIFANNAKDRQYLPAYDWLIGFYAESDADKTSALQKEKKITKEKQAQREYDKAEFDRLLAEAQNKNTEAYLPLATYYRDGKGTKEDLEEALRWANRALNHREGEAAVFIGKIYLRSDGKTSKKYAKLALRLGAKRDGCHLMYNIYRGGAGVRRNKLLFTLWRWRYKWHRMRERRRSRRKFR